MSATSNPAQSESSKGSLPAKRQLVEKVAVDGGDLKNDQFQSEPLRFGRRPLAAMIIFCIGVAATLAWQSYGDTARKTIAGSFPKLGWLAPQPTTVTQNTPGAYPPIAAAVLPPDQQQLNAISLDLDEVRQSVDRIATSIAAGQEQITRSVDRIAASQEQMARTVEQLTAGQEQVAREITKLQATEQYILNKNSQPPASKPVPRQSQARPAR